MVKKLLFPLALLSAVSGYAIDVATFPFPIAQQLALSRTNNFQTYTLFLIDDLIDRIQQRTPNTLTADVFSSEREFVAIVQNQSPTMQQQFELGQEIQQQQQEQKQNETYPIGDAMEKRAGDPPAKMGKNRPWKIYVGPIYRKGSTLTQSGCRGTRYYGAGFNAGFDYAFSSVGLGLTSQYIYGHAKSKHHGNKYTENPFSLSSYLTWLPRRNWALNANAGWEINSASQPRKTAHGVAHGTFPARVFNAMMGSQYTIRLPKYFSLIPEVDLRYCDSKTGSYHEHRANLDDVKYKHQTLHSLKLNISSRFNYTKRRCNTQATLDVQVAWQREFLAKRIASTWASIPSFDGYTTHTVSIPRNNFQFSADLQARYFNKYAIDLFYLFDWNRVIRDHNLFVTGSYFF